MTDYHVRPTGMPPANGYSHIVAFEGRSAVISGQVPVDERGDIVGLDDPSAQIEQVFANLGTALAAVGAEMDDVVKLTYYLTDLADLPEVRRIRDTYISSDHPPASTLVQVRGLVDPRFRLEVDAIATI